MSNSTPEVEAKYVKVGKVKDAHGIKGELFIVLFAGEAFWLSKLKSLRLVPAEDKTGEVLNFDIKSARLHKNGLIVKTLTIKDRNEAESYKTRLLEVPEEFLVSEKGEEIFLREIEGFQVITKAQGKIGPIVGFGSNGEQDLLIVKTAKGEFEIPFVEPFVDEIDYEAKEIHLDLPVGLLGEADDEDEVRETDQGADDEEDAGE